jgi:hypothetical protein
LVGTRGTDFGSAFGFFLIHQLELGLGGEIIHSTNPADDFSESQGLLNTGAGNAVLVASQALAKGILYL